MQTNVLPSIDASLVPRALIVTLAASLGALFAGCADDEPSTPSKIDVDAGGFALDGGADSAPGSSSCAVGNGGCSTDATCAEEAGAVRCTCKPGFSGDGATCVDVAASLNGLRWEIPCLADVTDPALCTTTPTNITKTAELRGLAGKTYDLKLRFRGVVEPKTYNGGIKDGFFNTGGTPAADTANVYKLTISAPQSTYYINAGTTRASNALYAEAIDYEVTIEAWTGATVTLVAQPLDALQIKNRDQAGAPFVVAGVPPAPAAFAGQFVQMDVLAVTAK